jgi:hypothetical protein
VFGYSSFFPEGLIRDSKIETAMKRSIVVESLIHAPLEVVWNKTQDPKCHVQWDIRFSEIKYLENQELLYRTHIGFGMSIEGKGRYLNAEDKKHSSFEFWSDSPFSLIKIGKGIWLYEALGDKTYFKTVFDYDTRWGILGSAIDWIFRPLFCKATEYSFEVLRLWSETGSIKPHQKKWSRFILSFSKPLSREKRTLSWLGIGHPKFSRIKETL